MTFSFRLAALLPFLALAFAAAPAQAQNNHVRLVRAQLTTVAQSLGEVGSYRTHDPIVDALWGNGEDSFTLTLRRGTSYAIYGACDRDCSDIDLWLYDENGNLIDSDVTSSDTPAVFVTPSWTGRFRVRVRMYACSVEPCYYGVGVSGN